MIIHVNGCSRYTMDSSSGGERSKEYGVENDGSSVGMKNVNCNESKAKQIREAVPLHPITPQMKQAVNVDVTIDVDIKFKNDITRNDIREQGTDCITDNGVGLIVRNIGEQEKDGKNSLRKRKGKFSLKGQMQK